MGFGGKRLCGFLDGWGEIKPGRGRKSTRKIARGKVTKKKKNNSSYPERKDEDRRWVCKPGGHWWVLILHLASLKMKELAGELKEKRLNLNIRVGRTKHGKSPK